MEEKILQTIGKVASGAGVNVQTVRYYERRGLLPRPQRTSSGYRQFGPDTVPRIRFIKRAQELGFSLGEIETLLSLRVDPRRSCTEVEWQALQTIERIDGKLHQLERMKSALSELVSACRNNAATSECPVLEALGEPVPGQQT